MENVENEVHLRISGDKEYFTTYSEGTLPCRRKFPDNIHVVRDTILTKPPYMIRMSGKQGFILFYTLSDDNPLMTDEIKTAIEDTETEWQFVHSGKRGSHDVALMVVHEYESNLVISAIKTAGCLRKRITPSIYRKIIKTFMQDVLSVYPDKDIVLPTYDHLQTLSWNINGSKIAYAPYSGTRLRTLGFKQIDDYYWLKGKTFCAS